MGSAFKTSIKTTGAFFTVDLTRTFDANVQTLMKRVSEEGETDVVGQLKAGQASRYPLGGGLRPGRVSGHVRGRVRSLKGKQWKVTAVVSVNNAGLTKKQGIKLMAAASWLESQTHAFRRTAGRLRRARAVNTTDLFKGIR